MNTKAPMGGAVIRLRYRMDRSHKAEAIDTTAESIVLGRWPPRNMRYTLIPGRPLHYEARSAPGQGEIWGECAAAWRAIAAQRCRDQ